VKLPAAASLDMIDLHHHCLPGVDDGPRDMVEAVELCRLAHSEGIETIVATPHVLRGRWQNTSREHLVRLAGELRDHLGDSPRLLLGSEYFFAHDMADVVARGDSVIPLAESKYVLVEFAANAIPPLVEQPFYRLQLAGWTPIIAHPERNIVLQSKPELLAALVNGGARTQITAGSFVGAFGREAEKAARAWLRAGLVHVIASDAHNTTKRPPRVAQAWPVVRELAGDAVAEALFRGNPRAVIENRVMDYEPDPRLPGSAGGLISRFRRLLGTS
jgi:protein-tyrosine phosphatase